VSGLTVAFKGDGSIIGSPKGLLQHLFTSTTANFVSSPIRSKQRFAADPITLPTTFFVNADALSFTELGFKGKLDLSSRFNVPYNEVYKLTIEK
jgi:hypothetical protein